MGTDELGGWQLDEAGAAAYERHLVPALFDPWATDLVGAVSLRAGQRVLDLACGTGIVARHVARHVRPGGEVTGVDVSPAMLSVAREAAAGLDPPIRWKEAIAHDLPFPNGGFDVVLCQQALQFFPDRPKALNEMRRVVAPGGRLGLSTCRSIAHQPGYEVLVDVLRRHVGAQASEVIRSPYGLGDPDELRGLVTAAGFRDVHLRIVVTTFRVPDAQTLLQGEMASSPLGDLVSDLDGDVRKALLDDLDRSLASHVDDDGVVFPFETLVVTATC